MGLKTRSGLKTKITRDAFLNLLQAQANELTRCTVALRKKPDPEIVHQLRVSIKRWRMTGRLLEKLYQVPWQEDFKPVTDLFKVCGIQRNLEQGMLLIKKHRITSPGLDSFFLSEWEKAVTTTRNAGRVYDHTGFLTYMSRINGLFSVSHLVPPYIGLRKEEDILLKKAGRLFQRKNRPLHKIRKRLKDLLFLREITKPGPGRNRKLNKNLDLLGKIQDMVVLEELAEQGYSNGKMEEKEKRKLIKKIRSIRQRLVKRSVDQLRLFLFPNK